MRRFAAPLAGLLLAVAGAGAYSTRPAAQPKPAPAVSLQQKVARAVSRGVEFLIRQQSDDDSDPVATRS
jgi:hypothetical protein